MPSSFFDVDFVSAAWIGGLLTSPFEDIEKYVRDREIARVAAEVGWMFARPVRPSDTDTDYLITQLLARMIREEGFDGAAYPSSQAAKGLNYVLFDPTLQCEFGAVQSFRQAWSIRGPIFPTRKAALPRSFAEAFVS